MITTSSKLLYGLGAGSTVAWIVLFIAQNGISAAVIAVAFLSMAAFFLGAVASFTRDGHVLSTDTASHASAPAAQRGAGRSWWPFGTAVATGFVVVGLISSPGIFKVGVGLLVAMLGEWAIQNWSDRASSNDRYNEKVRGYLVHPLELPVGGALLLAVIVLSFSRIMLAVEKTTGALLFALVGAVVLAVGTMVGLRRNASRRVVAGLCGIVLVALAGTGVATALNGEREQLTEAAEEDHFAHRPCGEEAEYADKKASRAVSMKSSITAKVVLEDGMLTALVDGFEGPQSVVTIQRSNPSTIIFINNDDDKRRMVVRFGTVTEDVGGGVTRETELEACTSKVAKGGQQSVTFVAPIPSFASEEPFSITVPGVEGARIDVVVP